MAEECRVQKVKPRMEREILERPDALREMLCRDSRYDDVE